jgi:hypothetical protein
MQAFRKTDKRASGDETKKTSEWVLEPFALEEGITPTTRYRVKSNKKIKSENPQRHRADAGRKGGLSAGKRNHKLRPRDESHARHRIASMTAASRHMSPSTPPSVDLPTSTPYFVKSNPFSFEGMDVKDVYPLDDGPVYCNNEHTSHGGQSQYGDVQTHMWSDLKGFSQC